MGIFKRIWNWLRSLFGGGKKKEAAELDRCVRTMQEALRSMKAQTEAVLAAQEQRKREIARCETEIAKMARYAEKAVRDDRDNEARFFLEKKAGLEKRLADLIKRRDLAAGYTSQAERLYQKAESQLQEVAARKDAVKAKLAAAELAEAMNRLESGRTGASLASMEADAQAALDKAEAIAELEGRSADCEWEALMDKYDDEAKAKPKQAQF